MQREEPESKAQKIEIRDNGANSKMKAIDVEGSKK